jgi:hypothetical protein
MLALARLLLIAVCTLVVASCGGVGGTTSSSSISPTQYANSQRDVGYLRAVNQATIALNKAPANPTDYKTGDRELRAAIRALGSLSVPKPFVAAQAHLVSALRAIDALGPSFERAARTGDRVAQNNLEAKNIRGQTAMNDSLREMVSTYKTCRASKFTSC